MSEPTAPPKFEHALAELEAIVRTMEDGDSGLEDSLAHYERGVGLLKQCYTRLREAEQRIQLVTGEGEGADGQPVVESFEPAATLELHRSSQRGGVRSAASKTQRGETP